MTAGPPDAGPSLWEVLIAFAMLIINLAGALIGGTWVLARSRGKVNEKIDQVGADLERRVDGEIDQMTQRFGETVTALREKIRETELWNRDNFVSKSTFSAVIKEMSDNWRRFEDKLDKRLDRIDAKLDNGQHGPAGK
jgi:hypothetical protein